VEVPLTLVDVPFEEQKDDPYDQHPQVATVHLEQHIREVEPHMSLGRCGSREGVHLTLAEAHQLDNELTKAVSITQGHCVAPAGIPGQSAG
jgi:hypothetical protein